ncbi:hypothetical protein, partial [Actinokineospora enzanensis]|uniref:hypothetical protein n=1 Tax=Actinokineospora enzanensis TaxID=155975 RepID=UPI0004766294
MALGFGEVVDGVVDPSACSFGTFAELFKPCPAAVGVACGGVCGSLCVACGDLGSAFGVALIALVAHLLVAGLAF